MTIIHAKPLRQFGISGPTSALNNEAPLFDGTTGKKIKAGSGFIITPNLMQAENKAVLLSGTTGGTPASGAGTRLMWIPGKAAFRAGNVNSGDSWDDANIGIKSVAFSQNSKASGMYSTCFGLNGEASGGFMQLAATHFGNAGIASNTGATHFGSQGTASGQFSTHFGSNGIASGRGATHFGNDGIASGDYSTHFGGFGKAEGEYSWVGGKYMQLSATAYHSFAWGVHSSAVALTQPNTFYIFPGGTAGKVAIGTATPAVSAIMDLTSTVGAFIPPRMTEAQRDALTPVNGMILYNNSANQTQTYENGAWRQI